ncbi:glycyl-tRNA ligase [Candidatus Mycoplasma haematolamae str. Purdue]|uniref:Glycyl-tRNA ligase n=1 Tax=Mycoplasma haematolamae (strain Purdue) TaxID=1212765 RepID=I7BAN0_MYCHA|nr:glycine--tRNA ligase [Candidatus Mycoplasma haematolamae]AFO52380.1 glycyl-tRNA ligase [Candidatus Mycoplasma haematolamae str. Purdue]
MSNLVEKYLLDKGFIFPSSPIYGGMESSWDYSHIGTLLKNNLKQSWINYFVNKQENTVLYEGNILTNKEIWKASGHVQNFEKQLVECKDCNSREETEGPIESCPRCGSTNLTEPKSFQLIFQSDKYYLRPETAQTIFVNTKLIALSSGLNIPFSVAQIGKAFRNEVSPGKTIFRTKEFEQMELEEFTYPEQADKTLKKQRLQIATYLIQELGFSNESFVFEEVTGADLPHYSLKNCDVQYKFEFGTQELWGIANRGDFDLKSHQEHSGEKLHFQNQDNSQTFLPHIVEHSVGLNRLMLALITEHLTEKPGRDWPVLALPPLLSPFKFSVLPLTKQQVETSRKLYQWLQSYSLPISFLTKGSIGKRYRSQDEIGTPYCLTVDFESKEWGNPSFSFTLRDRDSGLQERKNLSELKGYIFECLGVPREI